MLQANWLAAALAVLGGLYVALKAMQLGKAKIRLHDSFFTYGRKKIPYASVTKISCHQVPIYTLPTLLFHPLGNSFIYTVASGDKKIQILGKFYLDADVFVNQIAENANIEIAFQ